MRIFLAEAKTESNQRLKTPEIYATDSADAIRVITQLFPTVCSVSVREKGQKRPTRLSQNTLFPEANGSRKSRSVAVA